MPSNVKQVSVTTATGIFPASPGYVTFDGDAHRFLTYAMGANDSTGSITGTVEGSIGYSDKWKTVVTLATGTSTGLITGSSGATLFDKVRVNLSANASTASFAIWLAAGD